MCAIGFSFFSLILLKVLMYHSAWRDLLLQIKKTCDSKQLNMASFKITEHGIHITKKG